MAGLRVKFAPFDFRNVIRPLGTIWLFQLKLLSSTSTEFFLVVGIEKLIYVIRNNLFNARPELAQNEN